ncbi:hypothetical protein O181_017433 [Austropuccinia psidii MF-1]|uniref:Uncharacterized protein n=1 Tax=Austropuccinia psidii MF-1 TaxID=1389203 RepID=A0A9Q3C741_9BASI|nr:hypothetical protein [Austropuccinia psidii MF-1]
MESTIIQTSNQKGKGLAQQKEGGKQGRSPVASTSKPQVNQPPQEGKKTRKRTGGNYITQATGSQKSKNMPWTMSSTCPET